MQEEEVPLWRAMTLAFLTVWLASIGTVWAAEEQPLTVEQLVEVAIEVNPQVRAAKEQWDAAQHEILQNYAPADPTFTYGNLESSKDFNAAVHVHSFSESFQFPGKALLQADGAKRTAEIAGLTYQAAIRDLRASVETAYYQVLLDEALIGINAENIANLRQVVHVTQIQYTANQATQADLIGADFALAQAQLQQRQYQTNRANDRVRLNQLLDRRPASPLNLDRNIQLKRLELRLDKAVDTATHAPGDTRSGAGGEKFNHGAGARGDGVSAGLYGRIRVRLHPATRRAATSHGEPGAYILHRIQPPDIFLDPSARGRARSATFVAGRSLQHEFRPEPN